MNQKHRAKIEEKKNIEQTVTEQIEDEVVEFFDSGEAVQMVDEQVRRQRRLCP